MSLIEKALKQAEEERRKKDISWEILNLAFVPASHKKSSRIFFFFFFLPFLAILIYFAYLSWTYSPATFPSLSLKSITVEPLHLPYLKENKVELQSSSLSPISTPRKKKFISTFIPPSIIEKPAKKTSLQPASQVTNETLPSSFLRSSSEANLLQDHFERGREFLRKGEYGEAKKEFITSLELNPDNPEAHNNLGIIFQKEGNLQRAEEEFLKALKEHPSSEKILNNLGLNCYLMGKWDRALSYYQSALKINPENLETYNNLSILYKKLKNLEYSKRMLEKSLSLNPDNPESLYNMALLLEEMGEKEKAIIYYQKFVKAAGATYQELVEKVKNYLKETR